MRLARWAAAVVLAGLLIVVAIRLAGRHAAAPAPEAAPPPAAGPVDLKEKVRHQEFREGRLVADIRGDASFAGPDGRNHLKGAVEVVNYGPAGEVLSRLTAGEVGYDKASLRFEIAGRARIEAGGVVLEGEAFFYDKAAGLFGTTSGGRFSSKTLSGTAAEISYEEGADVVRLGGDFSAGIAAADPAGGTLALSGRSFLYARRERQGRIEGQASIQGPDHRATAGTIAFVAAADESGLDTAVLEGGAKVAFGGKRSPGGGEARADRIEVAFTREPSGFAVAASGGAVLSTCAGEGGAETVAAPFVLLSFFRRDGTWTWSASGGVRAEIAGADGPGRTIEAEEVSFDAGRTLHAAGQAGRPAVADSAEARIESPSISVAAASGALQAAGGVTMVLKKGDGSRRAGFFSREDDVSVSCERLEAGPESGPILFTGNVLVRQGTNSIRAAEIELAGDAGRMSGGGGVTVTMTEAGPDGRTVELAGRDLAYRPDTRTLTLATKAAVRLPEARLEAGTVAAVLEGDGRAVVSLAARTDVVVTKGRFTGRSAAADYDAAAGRITLTGGPVLTDDKGGSARGSKLTFDLADDKILIENEGPGRAATVVRS